MTDSKFAIIGAGIAGMTAARHLVSAGQTPVTVFDKGHKPGGRLSTRRDGEIRFNHGCQYFNARDPDFAALMKANGARLWPQAGEARFSGVPDMASLAENIAATLPDLRLETQITAIQPDKNGWCLEHSGATQHYAETLILTMPSPQATTFLRPLNHRFLADLANVHLAPCWTVMIAFEGNVTGPETMRPEASPLSWIARENARPERRDAPVQYTLQASAAWSQAHLEDQAADVTSALISAFARETGITTTPNSARAHRWRYALADKPLGRAFLWDPDLRLGLCGDWCVAGRLEAAYLSGRALGAEILSEMATT